MDTYKQICAKLVEAWDSTADGEYEDFGRAASYLVDWTRDALAEPEPKEPTDEELLKLTEDWPCTTGERHDLPGCPEVHLFSVFEDELIDFARAVLARWGK